MRAFLRKIFPRQTFLGAGKPVGRGSPGLAGDYPSFAEALCFGSAPFDNFQDKPILQKTLEGTRKLEAASAAGRLDELTDAKNLRLLGLLVALKILPPNPGETLEVLDFGGAMGNHYFKIRPFLDPGLLLRWTVLDMPKTVETARRHFQSRELAFVSDYQALGSSRPQLILASSSLQYTPDPLETLRCLQKLARGWLILDRMPFSPEKRSRILLQTVSPDYYDASYPVHLLQEAEILGLFQEPLWKLELRWKDEEESIQVDGRQIGYQGMAFHKKIGWDDKLLNERH